MKGCTRTRFETETKGNSEMDYFFSELLHGSGLEEFKYRGLLKYCLLKLIV